MEGKIRHRKYCFAKRKMKESKRKFGLEFEEAVFRFAKTLDFRAEVLFNHSISDRDTGEPRQCDVWINAKFGGHWPISILISCKAHKRKLHAGDIGAFCDEVRSTSANYGVIYSRSGFSEPALLKAKTNGLSCCRLYKDEHADIPNSVVFEQFACYPRIRLDIVNCASGILDKWNDIFSIKDDSKTVLELINAAYIANEKAAIDESMVSGGFPATWQVELEIPLGAGAPLKIRIAGSWKKYRARIEATLLNGSYCISNDSFNGTIVGASIDTWSDSPGEAWEEIADNEFTLPAKRIVFTMRSKDVKVSLEKNLGPLHFRQKLNK